MKRLKKRKRPGQNPIPFAISFYLTFIPTDLDDWEYEAAVRRVVRERLPEASWSGNGLWEEYDPFVSNIIEEELCRN